MRSRTSCAGWVSFATQHLDRSSRNIRPETNRGLLRVVGQVNPDRDAWLPRRAWGSVKGSCWLHAWSSSPRGGARQPDGRLSTSDGLGAGSHSSLPSSVAVGCGRRACRAARVRPGHHASRIGRIDCLTDVCQAMTGRFPAYTPPRSGAPRHAQPTAAAGVSAIGPRPDLHADPPTEVSEEPVDRVSLHW